MTIDISDCRQRAEVCLQAADCLSDAELRSLWIELAEAWAEMAQQAELVGRARCRGWTPAAAAAEEDAPPASLAAVTTGA
jgi:hypothetical protein